MQENDKKVLIAMVQEMADAQTAEQITKYWSDDVLWFDIQPHASKGKNKAVKEFSRQFAFLDSCKADLLQTEVILNGNIGIVCTIQYFTAMVDGKQVSDIITRQTDCFEKREGKWEQVHQHISLPVDGEWMATHATEDKFRKFSF